MLSQLPSNHPFWQQFFELVDPALTLVCKQWRLAIRSRFPQLARFPIAAETCQNAVDLNGAPDLCQALRESGSSVGKFTQRLHPYDMLPHCADFVRPNTDLLVRFRHGQPWLWKQGELLPLTSLFFFPFQVGFALDLSNTFDLEFILMTGVKFRFLELGFHWILKHGWSLDS